MRPDMAKVLCEEPRHGGFGGKSKPPKGYHKALRKEMESEAPRKHETTSPAGKYGGYGGGQKIFGEHLGPLKRYVLSCVGRKWDDIYSEICQHIDKGNVVQKHILTHLFDYIEKDVRIEDGKIYEALPTPKRWGKSAYPYVETRKLTYVHPDTGILCRTPTRPRPAKKKNMKLVLAGEKHCYVQDDKGIWWECWLDSFRQPEKYKYFFTHTLKDYKPKWIYAYRYAKEWDVFLRRHVQDGAGILNKTYGKNLYCFKRRQLNKSEIRKLKKEQK